MNSIKHQQHHSLPEVARKKAIPKGEKTKDRRHRVDVLVCTYVCCYLCARWGNKQPRRSTQPAPTRPKIQIILYFLESTNFVLCSRSVPARCLASTPTSLERQCRSLCQPVSTRCLNLCLYVILFLGYNSKSLDRNCWTPSNTRRSSKSLTPY